MQMTPLFLILLLFYSLWRQLCRFRWIINRKNRVFPAKTHQIFSVHTTSSPVKRHSHRSFWICVWRKLGQLNYRAVIVFESSVLKILSVHAKAKSRRFQIPPVLEGPQTSEMSLPVTDVMTSWADQKTHSPTWKIWQQSPNCFNYSRFKTLKRTKPNPKN